MSNETEAYYDEMQAEDQRPAAPLARRQEPAPMARRQGAAPLAARQEPAEEGSRLLTSRDVSAILSALGSARKGYLRVTKSRTADAGTRGSYTYANLSDVAKAVMPALDDADIFVMQVPSGDVLVTRLTHTPSGQWIEGSIPIVNPDGRHPGARGIQALGSALTYLRRYSLTAMLGIVPEDVGAEDDDGAAADGRAPARRVATEDDLAGAVKRVIKAATIAAKAKDADMYREIKGDFFQWCRENGVPRKRHDEALEEIKIAVGKAVGDAPTEAPAA